MPDSIIHIDCKKKNRFNFENNKLISYSQDKRYQHTLFKNVNTIYYNYYLKFNKSCLYQYSPLKGSNQFTFFYVGSYSEQTPLNSIIVEQMGKDNSYWQLRRFKNSNILELFCGSYLTELDSDKIKINCKPNEMFILCGFHKKNYGRGLIIKTKKEIIQVFSKKKIKRFNLNHSRAYISIGCEIYENKHLNIKFKENKCLNGTCNEFILYYDFFNKIDIIKLINKLYDKWF